MMLKLRWTCSAMASPRSLSCSGVKIFGSLAAAESAGGWQRWGACALSAGVSAAQHMSSEKQRRGRLYVITSSL